MALGDFIKNAASVAVPAYGAYRLGKKALGSGKLRETLFGQDPEDVELDPRFAETQRRREALQSLFEREASGEEVGAGEQAIQLAGRRATESAGRQARAMAAGARGFGSVGAQRQAAALQATQAQDIAGRTAEAAGRMRSEETARARSGLASLLDADIQQALLEEELRQKKAKPGLAGVLGSALGAGIGGYFGGGKGAMTGAQFGGTLGAGAAQAI